MHNAQPEATGTAKYTARPTTALDTCAIQNTSGECRLDHEGQKRDALRPYETCSPSMTYAQTLLPKQIGNRLPDGTLTINDCQPRIEPLQEAPK